MMIKTLTLNPALDKTIIVESFRLNQLNRIKKVHKDAGGKGINVSKMLKNLGQPSRAAGFLGGAAGDYIKSEVEKMGIETEFVETAEETRTNTKMVDPVNNTFTDLNEAGAFIVKENIAELKEKIFKDLKKDDILVLAGSVPAGVEDDIYYRLIKIAAEKGVKTILDADGPLFRAGIKAAPTLIKPNEHELGLHFKEEFKDLKTMIRKAESLLDLGIEMIMLSLGKEGAVFITAAEKYRIEPLKLDVKSTVGAGDAMVAGLAFGLENKLSLEEMLKTAAACSSATLIREGTEMGSREDTARLKKAVRAAKIC
ncbi:MAG: 1-phosphofructokinase [Halanaerobium sp.]